MSPLLFVTALLLVLSLMWPSEAAMQGDGLPLVLGWLITAGIAALSRRDRAQPVSLSGGWGVGLLLLAYWLSCGQVSARSGDRASATFLTLEWSALAAVWLLLRLLTPAMKKTILSVLLATCVGTAVYGFAQYFVVNQQTVEWYQAQLARLDAATTQVDRRAIESELQQMGVPSDRTGRELFQRRLLDSTEPTGPFALANTFGGVLAVALVLLIGVLIDARRQKVSRPVWWSCLLAVGAVGFCLLLTKSRTAWVGSMAGIVVLLAHRLRSARQLGKAAGLMSAVAVLTVGLGIGTGLLDREVVLESPKSLQYRLFYWMGASGVIAESPLWGVGPGNFRQSYLRYKVPESSEEILDPHNIFFDTWATLGLLGIVGLMGMLVSVVLASRPRAAAANGLTDSTTATADRPATNFGRSIPRTLWRVVIAVVVVETGVRFVRGETLLQIANPLNGQTLLLVIPIVMAVLASVWQDRLSFSRSTLTAAGCALLVHLCGAGGLQITVCGLLLLLLHSAMTQPADECLTPPPGASPSSSATTNRRWPMAVAGALCLLLAAPTVVLLTQQLRAKYHGQMSAARLAEGDLSAALTAAENAVAAAPSPNSRQQVAQVLSYAVLEALPQRARELPQISQGPSSQTDRGAFPETTARMEDALSNANAAIESLISADRRSIAGPQMRSQLMEAVLTSVPDAAFAKTAIDDLQFIVVNYPTNVRAWCRLALLQQQWGDQTQAAANRDRALELEEINRSWGHVDRYLTEEQLRQLNSIGSTLRGQASQ